MQQLEVDYPERPDITFVRVLLLLEDLWCHVYWASHTGLQRVEHVIDILAEPKVANLVLTVVHENVGWLEISVNDLFSEQLAEARNDLPHDSICIFFRKPATLLQVLFQVAILTELHDYVEAAF